MRALCACRRFCLKSPLLCAAHLLTKRMHTPERRIRFSRTRTLFLLLLDDAGRSRGGPSHTSTTRSTATTREDRLLWRVRMHRRSRRCTVLVDAAERWLASRGMDAIAADPSGCGELGFVLEATYAPSTCPLESGILPCVLHKLRLRKGENLLSTSGHRRRISLPRIRRVCRALPRALPGISILV
jgi:hypothetical protein